MANNVLFVRPGFITANAPLNNGLGRFLPQLMRLTLKFCKHSPSSAGTRQFIENDLVSFAETNPHVALYLKPRRHKAPIIVAEYLNGERHWHSLQKMSREEVVGWIDIFRTHSGKEFQTQNKMDYSDYPSIQGMWTPYTHAEPEEASAVYPEPKLSKAVYAPQTASEKLIQMFREQENESPSQSNLKKSQ